MIELPSGVQAVRAAGKVYYSWRPHRGTALEGKRVALGTNPRDPVFWEKLRAPQGKASGGVEPWTFAARGWRAMAVCDRRFDGLPHQEISAQLCMSMNMVMRYSKHINQERLAREANKRYS